MNNSIIGTWYSHDEEKTIFKRYTFKENGIYERADRTNESSPWESADNGTYAVNNKMLQTKSSSGLQRTEGYITIEGDVMIEGFLCNGAGLTIEDKWEMNIINNFTYGISPASFINSFVVEFKAGKMNGCNTLILNDAQKMVTPFSGKYTINGDVIEITESNANTAFLSNGTKKIVIIDGVLVLLDSITYLSYYTRG